jgi:hypothetical protein
LAARGVGCGGAGHGGLEIGLPDSHPDCCQTIWRYPRGKQKRCGGPECRNGVATLLSQQSDGRLPGRMHFSGFPCAWATGVSPLLIEAGGIRWKSAGSCGAGGIAGCGSVPRLPGPTFPDDPKVQDMAGKKQFTLMPEAKCGRQGNPSCLCSLEGEIRLLHPNIPHARPESP